MSAWWDRYVGLAWADKGRGPSGFDCWGLCREVLKRERGIELPSHTEDYATAADVAEISAIVRGEMPSWAPVPRGAQLPFDVALFRVDGESSHMGVVVERTRFLHIVEGSNAIVSDVESAAWRNRFLGYFRHAGAAWR